MALLVKPLQMRRCLCLSFERLREGLHQSSGLSSILKRPVMESKLVQRTQDAGSVGTLLTPCYPACKDLVPVHGV